MSRRRRGRGGYGGGGGADADGWFNGSTMLLRLEGVEGDSDVPGHEGWIELLAWSFGMSRSIENPKLPKRLQQLKKDRKKKFFADAGFDMNGQRIKKEEPKKADEEKELTDEEQQAAYRKEQAQYEEDRETFQELYENYDSDEEITEKFDDDEVGKRKIRSAHVQDISCTKWVSCDSAAIYSMVLGAKKGVKATLRVLKARLKPKTPEQIKAAEEKKAREEEEEKKAAEAGTTADADADAEPKKKKKSNGYGGYEEEEEDGAEEPEREYLVSQEFDMTDVFVTSASTGGSGGEDRLTENICLSFRDIDIKVVDIMAKYEAEHPKAAAASSSSSSSASSSSSSSSKKLYEGQVKYNRLQKTATLVQQ